MTAKRLTVDDVRHRAEEVRDLAKHEVQDFMDQQSTKAALVGVVAVVALVSLAFYLGARRAYRCDELPE